MLNPSDVLSRSLAEHLFSSSRELIPDIDDYYEMELAFFENQLLDDQALIRNSAYFGKVGESLTRHFKMCAGESLRLPNHSSSRLKSFFDFVIVSDPIRQVTIHSARWNNQHAANKLASDQAQGHFV